MQQIVQVFLAMIQQPRLNPIYEEPLISYLLKMVYLSEICAPSIKAFYCHNFGTAFLNKYDHLIGLYHLKQNKDFETDTMGSFRILMLAFQTCNQDFG